MGQLPGHAGAVITLAFDAAGVTLASGSIDRTLRLWALATTTTTAPATAPATPTTLVAHVEPAAPASIAAIVAAPASVTGICRHILSGGAGRGWGPVYAIAFAGPSACFFATGDGFLHRCAPASGEVRWRGKAPPARGGGSAAVTLSLCAAPDGGALLAGCSDGALRVWDPVAAALVGTSSLDGAGGAVVAIALTPCGTVWPAARDRTLQLHSMRAVVSVDTR